MHLQTRRRVWQAVCGSPGLNKSELARLTDLSWASVGHHLGMLEREGVVRLVRVGRTVHAAPTEFAKRLERTPVLTCPDARRVLATILDHPAQGTTDLGRFLGMTRKQARRHVYELVRAGLVESNGSYHPAYTTTRRGRLVAQDLAHLDALSRSEARDEALDEAGDVLTVKR